MIEINDFITPKLIERTYGRAIQLGDLYNKGTPSQRANAERLRLAGMRMARARAPTMLLFLEKGSDYLQKINDAQKSRFAQEGHDRVSEYSEYSQWKTAYLKAMEPQNHEDMMYKTLGWVYASVFEALQ